MILIAERIYIKQTHFFSVLFIGALILESILPALTFLKYLIPGLFVVVGLFSDAPPSTIVEKKAFQNFILVASIILFSFFSLLFRGQPFYSRFFIETFLILAPLIVPQHCLSLEST